MSNPLASELTADVLRALAERKLRPSLGVEDLDQVAAPGPRDNALGAQRREPAGLARAQPAAVLAPIVKRPEGLSVLLTLRASHLRAHSGQVAFPGG